MILYEVDSRQSEGVKQEVHLELAQNVANSLIEKCSPKQQREFLEIVENTIRAEYQRISEEAEKNLQQAKELGNQFSRQDLETVANRDY